jgi:DNA adenine methylase
VGGDEVKASPIIKWAGGKTKLLPELEKRLPKEYGRYYEPFAGGAALFFHLAPKNAVLGDMNPHLVNLYRTLSHDPDGVVRDLKFHAGEHKKDSRTWYYMVRDAWNAPTPMGNVERAGAFVYLNKTCFNGLWRVNKKGEFNVPIGDYTTPVICDEKKLRAAADVLARAAIRHAPYADTIRDAKAGDLIYFDPPYDGTFVGYTSDGFNNDDQARLSQTVRELAARGCHVLVSNSDTVNVRTLYAGLRIDSVQVGRAINSDASKRGKVGEVIVVAGHT